MVSSPEDRDKDRKRTGGEKKKRERACVRDVKLSRHLAVSIDQI